jgi:arylsulfatase A-like enzyme
MNTVVIVSDTFRRDNLGCYSDRKVHTPHLDRFAEKCVVFDRAYCSAFPTMPMRSDLMTGKYTFTYRGWAPLPEKEVILSQTLADAGYTTMGIVDTPFFIRNGYAYDRGFHDFIHSRGQGFRYEEGQVRPSLARSDVNYERRYEEDYCAPKTCLTAEHWLERHYKEKFFLYVDTWDPHEPFDPPAHYVELYKPDWDGVYPTYHPAYTYYKYIKNSTVDEKEINTQYACYCGKVTMVDRAVGRLIDRIESMGLMDNTVIIFTSDHGYYFGEHDIFGKSVLGIEKKGVFLAAPLYQEVNNIPLLIYVPGVKPHRTNALVSVPDFMPTILELAEAKVPDTVQGSSFLPVIKGEKDTHQEFVVSTMPLQNPGALTRAVDDSLRMVKNFLPATIVTDRWALLYARENAPIELYDIKSDPFQEKNIASDNNAVVKDLHKRYYQFLKKLGTKASLLKPRASL